MKALHGLEISCRNTGILDELAGKTLDEEETTYAAPAAVSPLNAPPPPRVFPRVLSAITATHDQLYAPAEWIQRRGSTSSLSREGAPAPSARVRAVNRSNARKHAWIIRGYFTLSVSRRIYTAISRQFFTDLGSTTIRWSVKGVKIVFVCTSFNATNE